MLPRLATRRCAIIAGSRKNMKEVLHRTVKPLSRSRAASSRAAIAPLMIVDLVYPAPKPWMLRHREEDDATGFERAPHFRNGVGLPVDVLDDIEGADRIELTIVGKRQAIGLDKFNRRRHAAGRIRQAVQVDFGSDQPRLGQNFAQAGKDESRPTADLEKRSGVWTITPDQRLDDSPTSTEPKTALLPGSRSSDALPRESPRCSGQAGARNSESHHGSQVARRNSDKSSCQLQRESGRTGTASWQRDRGPLSGFLIWLKTP